MNWKKSEARKQKGKVLAVIGFGAFLLGWLAYEEKLPKIQISKRPRIF